MYDRKSKSSCWGTSDGTDAVGKSGKFPGIVAPILLSA